MEMDGEFKPLQTILAADPYNIILNVTSRDKHVPAAERNLRTCKDRIRSYITLLPFKIMPKRMIIKLACGKVFWLDLFPNKYSVSNTLIPRTIMTGLDIDYKNHCQVDPGQYVHTHEEHGN